MGVEVLILLLIFLGAYGVPVVLYKLVERGRRRANRAKNAELIDGRRSGASLRLGRRSGASLRLGRQLRLLTEDSLLFEHDGVAIRVWPRAQNTEVWRVESANVSIGARFLFGHKLQKPYGFVAMNREFTFDAFATP